MPNPGSYSLSLTSFQKELWLAHEALPEGHPGISCGGKFVLTGCPDASLMTASLERLVRHFPLLSATLQATDSPLPQLHIGAHPKPDFRIFDLRGEADPQGAASAWLDGFKEEAFRPLGGPLCRFALVLLDADCSWFINRFFHIVGDGVFGLSQYNLMAEIYQGLLADDPVDLGPPRLWDDDVARDEEYLASNRAAKDSAFWREHLAGLPPERAFTPRLGHADLVETIGRCEQELSPELSDELRALAARHGAGISETFIALHLVTLARLFDRDTVSLQVPLRFGERRDHRNIQGHRVNVAPLILRLTADSTFAGLLGEVLQQLRALSRRARTPFQTGNREGSRRSRLEHVWDTNINYLPMLPDGRLGAVTVRSVVPVTSRLDPVLLGIYILEGPPGQGFHPSIDYSHNHFTPAMVGSYIDRLGRLLNAATANPNDRISGWDTLLPGERDRIEDWQCGPERAFAQGTIPELFDRVAARHPRRVAVFAEDGNRQSYAALRGRADAIAGWLTAIGLRPGQVVGVLARRHPALAETILGLMKAGGIYLPLDPDYPEARLQHMLEDSGATLVLALEPDDATRLSGIRVERVPRQLPVARLAAAGTADAAAYLIYTSGSTGRPKGVLVPHRGFVNMIQGQIGAFGVGTGDRVLQFASPSFDASLSEIFMALLAGGGSVPSPASASTSLGSSRTTWRAGRCRWRPSPPPTCACSTGNAWPDCGS